MIILEVNEKNILSVGKKLRQGYVIVYPTDTSYALGGIFDSRRVIQKILKIKKRKDAKFTLIASNLRQAENFFPFSSAQRRLAKKYWPGPFSLVVSKKFAIRVPKNSIARELARLAQKPIIATSANISGKGETYSSQDFLKQIKNHKHFPDNFLDAGKLKKIKPSTIVKVFQNGKIIVVRKGPVVISGLRRQNY